jgi:hypothetical protein
MAKQTTFIFSSRWPDGLLPYQKCQFWYSFEGLWMEQFGIAYSHLVLLLPFWYILWPFWYILWPFWFVDQEKSGNPDSLHNSLETLKKASFGPQSSFSLFFLAVTRVARWNIFEPKLPVWVNFGWPWNEKVGIFYGHLKIYIMAIEYILWPFDKLGAIWYILPRFGILGKEKSGNPGSHRKKVWGRL